MIHSTYMLIKEVTLFAQTAINRSTKRSALYTLNNKKEKKKKLTTPR